MKSVPGWVLEVHEYNKAGVLSPDPLYTRLTRDCPFNGTLLNKDQKKAHIYRFLGVFRVKEQGRYVFTTDLTCGFGHPCDFTFKVDDQTIMNVDNDTTEGRIQNGIPLSVGDHTIEVITRMTKTSYIKYDPYDRFRWRFLVKGPDDFNAREFGSDELFAVVPESVKSPVMSCNY